MNNYLKDQLEENLKAKSLQDEKQAKINSFVNNYKIEIFDQELKLAIAKIRFSVEEQIMRGSTDVRVNILEHTRNSSSPFITTINEVVSFMRSDDESSKIDITYDGLPYLVYEEFENWIAENGLVLNIKRDMHDGKLTLHFSPFSGEADSSFLTD